MPSPDKTLGRRIVARAPEAVFPLRDWYFALYAGGGFVASGLLHAWVWSDRSDRLAVWFRRLGLDLTGVDLSLAVAFTLVLGATVTLATLHTFRLVETSREAVFWWAQMVWIFPVLSQLIASSVTKFVYEVTFLVVAGGGFLLTAFVLDAVGTGPDPRFDPWGLMRTTSRGVLGLTALLVGSVATAILSQFDNSALYNQEITRQILLLGYYAIGVFVLLFSPILIRVLEGLDEAADARTA